MISDILYEALSEIERYQREMPEIYVDDSDLAVKIEAVKLVMRAVQMYLDTPPEYLPGSEGKSLTEGAE